jgi:fructose-1,6-bisphosphatase/sedoheptulose 1,7-bisphosphatase-like protein
LENIEYYCGKDFDPRIGQELSAPQYYLRKIAAAKETKIMVDLTEPLDGVRSNRIARAIKDWQMQYDEIFKSRDT